MKRCVLFLAVFIFSVFWANQLGAGSGPAHAQNLANSDYLACHNNPNLTKQVDGKPASLQIQPDHFRGSAHGSLNCVSCHSDVKALPHGAPPAKVSCSECHKDASAAYNQGLHAQALQNGNPKAATCGDCHGNAHEILRSSDPRSNVNHANIAQTCGVCHGQKFVMEGSGISSRPFFSYEESVHGRAVASGNPKAAVCTDCHGNHDIRPPSDSQSSIFRVNIPQTCGQCHKAIADEFNQSVHGQALARGNGQTPVCTDCHGIHLIKSHTDPSSSVASQALAKTTCAQCHEGMKLAQEFDVPGKRASSYMDSYHGLASKMGSSVVANCASCHGIHNILPSTDAKSMINRQNLAQTCGKCHPGASENFILGKVHLDVVSSPDIGSTATRWVRWIYLPLIGLVIGGMLVHNGLIWGKKALAIRRAQNRDIVRLTRRLRLQHALLLTSFTVLVLTGFALKYPDSWLGAVLASEAIRRVGHRIAAVVMLVAGAYHVAYLMFTKEGREGFRDLLPRRKDLSDVWRNLAYYAGRGSTKPEFGRFGYAEKAEYWALVWGTLIMGLTGLMIWFKLGWFAFLPRWFVDIAGAIHFYEAILATLAIVVWHLYQVIFDPDVYPLNWAFWDGRISTELYKEEHGLDYRKMTERGAEESSSGPGGQSALAARGQTKDGTRDPSPAPAAD